MGRNGRLQVEDDIGFQRREWVVERIAWVVIGALLVAALLGVFGTGPLSRTTAENPEGTLAVTYQRFERKIADTELQVRVATSVPKEGKVTVFISDDWIDNVDVQQISPSPDSATRTDDGIYYEFSARPDSPVAISIEYRPNKVGVHTPIIRAGDTGEVNLWQLTYL